MDKFLFSVCEAFVIGFHFGHFVSALYTHDYGQAVKDGLQLLMGLLPYVCKLWSR